MLQKIRQFILRTADIKKPIKIAIIIIGILGLMDSSYLTYSHYKAHPLNCFTEVKEVNSCQVVAESIYSTVLGFPVSLIGMFFYITIIILGVMSLQKKYTYLLNLLLPISALAVLFSMRLTYLQIYVIGYICYYCIFSALLSIALLGLSWKIYNEVNGIE